MHTMLCCKTLGFAALLVEDRWGLPRSDGRQAKLKARCCWERLRRVEIVLCCRGCGVRLKGVELTRAAEQLLQ